MLILDELENCFIMDWILCDFCWIMCEYFSFYLKGLICRKSFISHSYFYDWMVSRISEIMSDPEIGYLGSSIVCPTQSLCQSRSMKP